MASLATRIAGDLSIDVPFSRRDNADPLKFKFSDFIPFVGYCNYRDRIQGVPASGNGKFEESILASKMRHGTRLDQLKNYHALFTLGGVGALGMATYYFLQYLSR